MVDAFYANNTFATGGEIIGSTESHTGDAIGAIPRHHDGSFTHSPFDKKRTSSSLEEQIPQQSGFPDRVA